MIITIWVNCHNFFWLKNLRSLLASNRQSVSVPEAVKALQARYSSLLKKQLKKKRVYGKSLVDAVSADLTKSESLGEYFGSLSLVVNTGGGNCFYKSLSIFLLAVRNFHVCYVCLHPLNYLLIVLLMCNNFLGISAKEVANFQYILSFKSSNMIFTMWFYWCI